jgi:hypothetical protein
MQCFLDTPLPANVKTLHVVHRGRYGPFFSFPGSNGREGLLHLIEKSEHLEKWSLSAFKLPSIHRVDRAAFRKLKTLEWTDEEDGFSERLLKVADFNPEKLILECAWNPNLTSKGSLVEVELVNAQPELILSGIPENLTTLSFVSPKYPNSVEERDFIRAMLDDSCPELDVSVSGVSRRAREF